MYEKFYALDRRPFAMTPDPSFIYWSEAHTLAFTMLRYGLMNRAPITMVTGEIGAGKTTLLRRLLNEIDDELVIGLVSNLQPGRGQLLQWVMMALNEEPGEESYIRLFSRFQDFVVRRYAEGKRVVLIFDEAQNMSVDLLEELRMLSNINADQDELLQIVLVGQPQLRDLVTRPELTQFAQRIASDFHLQALDAEEVEAYIQHRLAVAGASWRIFPRSTCHLIHEATRGVPRLVNTLCDLCLVYGYAAESKIVDDVILRDFLRGAQRHGVYEQFAPIGDGPKLVVKA